MVLPCVEQTVDISIISTQYLHHLIRDIVRRGGQQLRQGELVHPGAGAAVLHLNIQDIIIVASMTFRVIFALSQI